MLNFEELDKYFESKIKMYKDLIYNYFNNVFSSFKENINIQKLNIIII
jgi:hypothetical protein